MRVAIAGGNGFVGQALTAQLTREGHVVVWLSHSVGRVRPPAGVSEVAFSPADENGPWRDEVFSADGVVNLSGYPIASRWNPRVKELLVSSRIDTTRLLVGTIAEARGSGDGPQVYVGATGIGIFGEGDERVLTEESPVGGDWLSDLAVAWENEALNAEASGCRAVVVRTGLVLGDEGLLPKLTLPMKLFIGGPVGNGRQWTPWIHLDDIVGIYRYALENPAVRGAYNACAPTPVRMSEFAATLGRVLHRPSWFPVPGFVMSLVLGEVAPYTLMSQNASSAKVQAEGYRFLFPELEGALRELIAG
jgi:uncharacterized protein (TIGR01777 family)